MCIYKKRNDGLQHVTIRGWSWAPGWVTVMSLCCFCNVALIFATMKTFILQQVKCRHLSPFLFKLNLCRIFPHYILFIDFFFSSPLFCTTNFPLLLPSFASGSFRRSPQTPSLMWSSLSDHLPLYLSKAEISGGTVRLWGAEDFSAPSSVQISAFSSLLWVQLLMKSQSVLWTVTWSWIRGFWPLVSTLLWCLNFQFTRFEGVGEVVLFFLIVCFSYINFATSAVSCYDICVLICSSCGPWTSHPRAKKYIWLVN